MIAGRRFSFAFVVAVPFLALGLAGPRPLHDVPGHAFIGLALFAAALACLWSLAAAALRQKESLALAGLLLLAPWLLILLLWTGLGPPFQATLPENEQRYVLLMVNAALVGAAFVVLHDALRDRGECFFSAAMLAAAIPATGLYLACVAITLANATMAVQGDHAPFPPLMSHLYDALEFFGCLLTYLATALAVAALGSAGLLGRTAVRVFLLLCTVIVVLLVLRGIEYPEISGHVAPWYTQPGVIVRIPAIAWLMAGVIGAMLLRRVGAATSNDAAR